MRREVFNYFAGNGVDLKRVKMIGVHRKGLDGHSIEAAAENLYDEIVKENLEVKPIRMAWEIYRKSLPATSQRTVNKEMFDAISKKLDYLMLPWWKRLFRRYDDA